MATLADVQAALTQAATDAAAEKVEFLAAVKVLNDQIVALQGQLAAGNTVTSADLDALVASVQGIDSQVKDIVPTPVV